MSIALVDTETSLGNLTDVEAPRGDLSASVNPSGLSKSHAGTAFARYLVRRQLQVLLVVWGAFTLSFIILFVVPGDSVTQHFAGGDYVPPEQIASLQAQYGLDRSFFAQYTEQLGGLAHGDLGTSIRTGIPVLQSLLEAFPETLKLAGLALAISLVVGSSVAVLATITRLRWLRHLLLSVPALGLSLPGFWVGLTLLWLFSFTWPIFPAIGNAGFLTLVLPALTMSVHTSSTFSQVLARSIDDEWSADYVQTARAKGLGRWAIQLRHVLRNAAVPTSTVIATTVGGLLAGTVISETIFSRNGIGRLTQIAVTDQDLPVVQGVVVLAATVYALVNLAVDLVYPILDPRILKGGGKTK